MSSPTGCSKACDIFSYWVIPERLVHDHLGSFYAKNPVMARVMVTPVALLSGIIKAVLFPVISAVGVVVMPIIALVRVCQGKKDAGDWLKAWCFAILGVAGSVAFIALTSYYLPLVGSSALFVGILAVSITFHVYKFVKEPADSPLLSEKY